MKFSTYLTHIKGVSIYPMISLGLFMAFVLGVLYYVYKMKPTDVEHNKNLPFN